MSKGVFASFPSLKTLKLWMKNKDIPMQIEIQNMEILYWLRVRLRCDAVRYIYSLIPHAPHRKHLSVEYPSASLLIIGQVNISTAIVQLLSEHI